MEGYPLISVAMATYNGERFLREQLDSIYAQTYPNLEVMVCDDCSTDGTAGLLEEYRQKFGLRYVVNERNVGFLRNFEKAVDRCGGEYIALADQDDVWLPQKLEILYAEIGGCSLACSDAALIDASGKQFEASFIRYAHNVPMPHDDGRLFARLLFSNFVTGCTTLMTKELIQKAHPIPEGVRYHDWWYGLMASTLHGISFHSGALVLYRQHAENDTGAQEGTTLAEQALFQLHRRYGQTRSDDAEKSRKRLQSYLKSGKFSEEELRMIKEAIAYLDDRQHGAVHWKAFLLALKYRNEIYFNVSPFMRYVKCIRSLLL